MKAKILFPCTCLCIVSWGFGYKIQAGETVANQGGGNVSRAATINSVPFYKVRIHDKLLGSILEVSKTSTAPYALDRTKEVLEDLKKCGQIYRGDKSQIPSQRLAGISDLFKAMEGGFYQLAYEKNPQFQKRLEEYVDTIKYSQRKDGYIYGLVHEYLPEKYNGGAGKTRYSNEIMSHELYNVGHMYEGAIAQKISTGNGQWLEIAEKNAQHVNKVFFEGDPDYNNGKPILTAPGHQEIEYALCRLYEHSKNDLYLAMAKKFIDIRGINAKYGPFFPEYAQQHKVVRDQREAVGHAVRFTYLWTAVAAVCRLTGDETYMEALKEVWTDLVSKKLYITGGLGGGGPGEGFAGPYELPNRTAYSETCAAIGNVFFCYEMFLLTGDAIYLDIAEISLYNTSLAGVSLDGKKFNYVNPLESDGRANSKGVGGRLPWYGTACCNTNIARFFPQIPGYMYAYAGRTIYINFYGSSETNFAIPSASVKLIQESSYPLSGKVKIKVLPDQKSQFRINLRIPTWARTSQFMPGQLYNYTNKGDQYIILVNGKEENAVLDKGFASIEREWSPNDVIELDLQMKPRLVASDEKIAENKNRVAVTCGPLVYVAEAIDNGGAPQRFYMDNSKFKGSMESFKEGVLSGIPYIKAAATDSQKKAGTNDELKLIPYYSWNNRGDFQAMQLWMATQESTALHDYSLLSLVESKKYGKVSASFTGPEYYLGALTDGKQPESSDCGKTAKWSCHPQKTKGQFVIFEFDKPKNVNQVQVYWADNGRDIKVPATWRVEKKINGKWVDYSKYITDEYTVDKNVFNTVMTNEIKSCDGIMVHIEPQKGNSVGIFEIKIDE